MALPLAKALWLTGLGELAKPPNPSAIDASEIAILLRIQAVQPLSVIVRHTAFDLDPKRAGLDPRGGHLSAAAEQG